MDSTAADPGSTARESDSTANSRLLEKYKTLVLDHLKLEELIGKREEELIEEKEKMAAMEQEILQLKNSSSESEHRNQLDCMDKLIDDLKAEIAEMKNNHSKKLEMEEKKWRTELSQTRNEHSKRNEHFDQIIEKLRKGEQEMITEVSERDTKIEKQCTELKNVREELSLLQKKLNTIEEDLKSKEEALENAQAQLENKVEEISNYKTDAKKNQETIEALKKQVLEYGETEKKLQKMLSDKQSQITALKNFFEEGRKHRLNEEEKYKRLYFAILSENPDFSQLNAENDTQYANHQPSENSRISCAVRKALQNNGLLPAVTSEDDESENQRFPGVRIRNSTEAPPVSGESGAISGAGRKRSLASEPDAHCSSQGHRLGRRAKRQKPNPQQAQAVETPNPLDRIENNIFQAVLEGKSVAELKGVVEQGSPVEGKNNAGESILHLAIHHMDPEVIKYLITAGADVNLKDSSGDLPIHKLGAVEFNFEEKLTALCENGADINAENSSGNTILHLAAAMGRKKEDIKLIISKSGNWKKKNKYGHTVLHLAVEGGNSEVVKYLIEELGMVIHAKDNLGQTPLHRICLSDQEFKEKLNILLAHGAAINATDKNGGTVLGLAAWSARPKEDLEYIISKGGDWKSKDQKGLSILHLAVVGGNHEVIKYLIEEVGMNIHVQDKWEEMPVHKVPLAEQNFTETLDAMLAHGAAVNTTAEDGDTVLGLAALAGRSKEDLEYIISKGGDWKTKNLREQSILHLAAEGGNPEAIKYLIGLGADVSSKDIFGATPLHGIAFTQFDFKGSLDVLLDYGVDINEQCKDGSTLLSLSTFHGRPKADLEYIVEKGGDWKLKAKSGQTGLHMAVQGGNIEAIKYFISLGLPIDSKDNLGRLAVHYLIENKRNFNETLELVLSYDTNINSVDGDGDTLLGLAAVSGRGKKVLEFIVSKGADWENKNKKGQSILHLVAFGGNVKAIKYILSLVSEIDARNRAGHTPMHLLAYGKKNFKKCLDTFLDYGADVNARNNRGRTLLDIAAKKCKSENVLEYIISKGGTSNGYYDRWVNQFSVNQ